MAGKSFLVQKFAKLKLGSLHLIGYSVAGEESVVQVPELDVCFDIGRSPYFALTSNTICITHVDEQGFVPEARQAGREIDAGGCFAAATLLIDDRERPHSYLPWSMRGQSLSRNCGMLWNGG